MMRKGIPVFLFMIFFLFGLASADTTYDFPESYSKVELSDNYIILTPDNLSSHPELLASIGKNEEDLRKDWADRGVQLQAWTQDHDACVEIITIQDEDASTYFDVDQQTTQMRTAYRTSFLKGDLFKSLGYKVSACEWKNTANAGRFLKVKYSKTVNGYTSYGYMRRTIRNGWSIIIDYQIVGRGFREKDLANIDKVVAAWSFTENLKMPDTTLGLLEFTAEPPAETSTGKFKVEGNCYPGANLIGVVMKMADPSPTRFTTTANKNGKFKLDVQLPNEGVWLMTLTIENNGVVIADKVFDVTNYQKTLLPINWLDEVPEALTEDETVISGITAKNVSVQCIVTTPTSTYEKMVKTNGTGKFTFKVPTSAEAEYNFTLSFQKKNYSTRRFTYTVQRTLTEEDKKAQVAKNAIKPAYVTLKKKITGYTGKTMVYTVTITDIQQAGDEWIITAAMTKTKKGTLKDLIVITDNVEPDFIVGSQQKFYGLCTGMYQIQSEEGNTEYPSFAVQYWN